MHELPKGTKMPVNVPKPAQKTPTQVAMAKAVVKKPTEVLYPEIQVNGVTIPITVITEALAKKILGWETEEEYSLRVGVKTEFGEEYLLKDANDKKVRCHHNSNNRPFGQSWAEKLGQTILSREWSDSRNGLDMTVNGETIVITKYGEVDSGQHRLIGLIFACQEWRKQKAHWIEKWPEEPTIEALIVTGVSDNPKVTQTLDYVKPRTLTDVFFTSPLFRDMSRVDRAECSRALGNATNLLWERTRAANGFVKYQTTTASLDYVDRHPKMLEAVQTIFKLNRDRTINTALKMQSGDCAGLLYLMGASATDPEDYGTSSTGEPPSEKQVKWTRWQQACDFWKGLTTLKDTAFQSVRDAMIGLIDADVGLGGRRTEKHAVICKAWNRYVDGLTGPALVDNPVLEYVRKSDGNIVLVERPNVGGIDSGPPIIGEEPPPPGVIAERKEKEKQERIAQMEKVIKERKVTPAAPAMLKKADDYVEKLNAINKIKEAWPGRVILFKTSTGNYVAWASDATAIALMLGEKTTKHESGMYQYVVKAERYQEVVKRLITEAKRQVAVSRQENGKDIITDVKIGPAPSSQKTAPLMKGPNLRPGTGEA